MQPQVRPLPAFIHFGNQPIGGTIEATIVLQVPARSSVRVERIETDSPDVRVEPASGEGAIPGRTYHLVQRVTKEGRQASAVRFFLGDAAGQPRPLSMEVTYVGEPADERSGLKRGEAAP